MEEQKNVGKEVKMKPIISKKEASHDEGSFIGELQKWTKDKLIQQVIQMNRQLYSQDTYVNRLKNQIEEMQNCLLNKRLEYLFKVVEVTNNYRNSDYPCFDKMFVEECLAEIQEFLAIQQEENNKEDN